MEKDKLSKYKTLKYMWNNSDIYGYEKNAGGAPINSCSSETALMCNGSCQNGCVESVDRYYQARRLSVERNSYSDVAGWLGGWLAGCHTPVLYQNG